jgi:hypothetical protein
MMVSLSLESAMRGVQLLLGWSVLIQSVEYLRMQSALQAFGEQGVWRWSLQEREMPTRAPWFLSTVGWLFAPVQLKALFLLRALGALCLMVGGAGVVLMGFLFVSTVLLLFRFRGAFNGGSDFMTLVAVSGLFLSDAFAPWVGGESAHHAALWYIALHALSSYFVSGWVKLKRAEWRSGEALVIFLDAGIYGPLGHNSVFRQPRVARLCSWSFMLWEALSPAILIGPVAALFFCGVAAVFHFLVFWYFGLNRFFWAWMVTFPALVYCSGWAASF